MYELQLTIVILHPGSYDQNRTLYKLQRMLMIIRRRGHMQLNLRNILLYIHS